MLAAGSLLAKSHISRMHVSAVTDELAKTQADAIAAAQKFKIPALELRKVPGTNKEFVSLSQPEIKQMAAELGVAKMKVAMVHAETLQPGVIAAAAMVSAARIRVAQPDAAAIAATIPAIEQAKMQLVLPISPESHAILEKNPSKALGLEWDPIGTPDGYTDSPKGRIFNIRVRILTEANWRRKFEAFERDKYDGGISLETKPEEADDAVHDLMRIVDDF